MALIQLFANGIAIDFVKETLSIKKENNALITDFKVSYSSVPFLIIENATTIQALGSRDLTSINKKRIIPVDVIELGEKYYGELQVLSYVNGYRKCNLKYASQVLTIMNKKIADFMPVVSVIPDETNPIPYTTEVDKNVEGEANWDLYPTTFLTKNYPEVKWQFPTMDWPYKYGTDLKMDDDWFDYQGKINNYADELLVLNTGALTAGVYRIVNKNIVAPQVFLLSPLFYALQQIGFYSTGTFTTNEFIKRILMYSPKDNLTKSRVFNYFGESPIPISNYDPDSGMYIDEYTTQFEGFYYLNYSFTMVKAGVLKVFFSNIIYATFSHPGGYTKTYTGKARIPVSAGEVGSKIYINYLPEIEPGIVPDLPVHSIGLGFGYFKQLFQMHTTIETGRYVPDWTFGDYLNQLKNTFNLDITINDVKKEVSFNFVEDFILSEQKHTIDKSLEIKSYEQVAYEAFILSYANDTDEALYITSSGEAIKTTQSSEFDFTIKNKFKMVPRNGGTALLSEELQDKDGVGLMIYDPLNNPAISESYAGKNLNIAGSGGIYKTFWRNTLKLRLNASVVELSGPFSELELKKIANIKKVYIDNQGYLVASLEYSETNQENLLLTLRLESINY